MEWVSPTNRKHFTLYFFTISLPPANEVWGKVICLQVCVCPQGGACSCRGCLNPEGGACSGGCLLPGGVVPVLEGFMLRGASSQGGPAPGRWCLVLGGGLVETPPTATAAGGTYPTGMHSCFTSLISQYCRKIYFLSDASLQPVGESTLMADTVRNCTKQTMCQNQRGIITIQCHLLQTKTTFLSMVTI